MSRKYTFKTGELETRIFKLPVEELTLCFDFGPRLGTGETLASDPDASIECDAEATPDLTAASITIAGTQQVDDSDPDRIAAANECVTLKLSGGTEGLIYDLTVWATDSSGDIKAGRLQVEII